MPNWVRTEIEAKGIEKLNIYNDEKGEKVLDFNMIIKQPSPEDKDCPKEYLQKISKRESPRF